MFQKLNYTLKTIITSLSKYECFILIGNTKSGKIRSVILKMESNYKHKIYSTKLTRIILVLSYLAYLSFYFISMPNRQSNFVENIQITFWVKFAIALNIWPFQIGFLFFSVTKKKKIVSGAFWQKVCTGTGEWIPKHCQQFARPFYLQISLLG